MKSTHVKSLLFIQTLLLFCGTLFAWSRLIVQLQNFQFVYGTLWRFRDCSIPNPLTTACFFGSVAFVVALLWSVKVWQTQEKNSERWLKNFLLFCVLFAFSVLCIEFVDYYKLFPSASVPISCSPGVAPWKTPCFFGFLFFTASYVTSIITLKWMHA